VHGPSPRATLTHNREMLSQKSPLQANPITALPSGQSPKTCSSETNGVQFIEIPQTPGLPQVIFMVPQLVVMHSTLLTKLPGSQIAGGSPVLVKTFAAKAGVMLAPNKHVSAHSFALCIIALTSLTPGPNGWGGPHRARGLL
jgi:hypothetical protein